jgi:hypothetical protein
MTARDFAGWRGAWILLAGTAIALALPLVFGTGWHAAWDWSIPFVTLVFVVLPALSVVHIGLTVLLVRQLSGRRRTIEMASLAVPVSYLTALAKLDFLVAKLDVLL